MGIEFTLDRAYMADRSNGNTLMTSPRDTQLLCYCLGEFKVLSGIQRRMCQETKEIQAKVDGDHDRMALKGKLAPVIIIALAISLAAVTPDHYGQVVIVTMPFSGRIDTRRKHIEIETVFVVARWPRINAAQVDLCANWAKGSRLKHVCPRRMLHGWAPSQIGGGTGCRRRVCRDRRRCVGNAKEFASTFTISGVVIGFRTYRFIRLAASPAANQRFALRPFLVAPSAFPPSGAPGLGSEVSAGCFAFLAPSEPACRASSIALNREAMSASSCSIASFLACNRDTDWEIASVGTGVSVLQKATSLADGSCEAADSADAGIDVRFGPGVPNSPLQQHAR